MVNCCSFLMLLWHARWQPDREQAADVVQQLLELPAVHSQPQEQ